MRKILLVFILLPILVYSQNNLLIKSKKIINEKKLNHYNHKITSSLKKTFDLGTSIGETTTYDYFGNSIINDQITYYNGMPYFSNMVMPFNNGPTTRGVVLSYFDGSSWLNCPISSDAMGWPQIDISLSGDSVGLIGITASSPSSLFVYEGNGNFRSNAYGANDGSSFQFSGNNIFLAGVDDTETAFFKSTDFGTSFSQWGKLSDFPIYSTASVSEVDMFKSPNEQNLVYASTSPGDGEVFDGVSEDHADNLWLVSSTDHGINWSGESIGYDGEINSVTGYHTSNYAPLFENFGQIDGTVGNDGIIHIVANGYGPVFDSPSGGNVIASSFPVLYWNSISGTWKSISDPAIDSIQMDNYSFPGNDLGQCYPGMAESDDGQALIVLWTGPQLNNLGQIDTAGANGTYWTDVYFAYSLDAGTTWNYGGTLLNDPTVSESFAHPAQHIRTDGNDHYIVDIVYLADMVPGVSIFPDGGAQSDNPIMYLTYDLSNLTSVDQNENIINKFELSQNYPNPFNPTTSIQYAINSRQFVSLKVYDVLGKEVAALVNEEKKPGTYEVKFDGSRLSSGIYFYRIKTGSFVQTKKMVLLK